MKKLFISLVALLPLLGFAQSEQIDLMQVIPNDPAVRVGTLDSGIKYYIRHNSKDAKRANFHIVYNVGAVQEEDNQNGLAHFLEHMAFNGSKNFPDNSMIDYLQSIGVRFGENLNAGTGQEQTTYMVTNVPITREGIVDSVLLVLHDWAGFIDLKEKDIDEERGVIREEWRTGNSAQRRIMEKESPAMFNNSIYAKRNVIGNEEVLKSFTYEDLRSFYRKWYRPDMQAFVIVGDFDVDQMEAKLKKTMADIKEAQVKTPKAKVVVEDNDKPLVSVATDPEMTATVVKVLFRHKPIAEKYANRVIAEKNDIVTTLINMMINERLDDISKKENAPFLDAQGAYFKFVDPFDAFYVYAQGKDNQSSETLEAVYTELLRMQRGGFSASELERAKANLSSRQERAFNNRNDRRNVEFISAYMDNFLNNKPYSTPDYELELDKKIIASTTLEEINATASGLVRDKNSAILISAPASTEVPTETQVMAIVDKVNKSEIEINVQEVKMAPLVDESTIKAGKIAKEEDGKFGTKVLTMSNGARVILKKTDFKADEVILSAIQYGGTSTIENDDDLISLNFYDYFSDYAGLGAFSQSDLNKVLTGKIASANVTFSERTANIQGASTPKDIETMLQLAYLRVTAPRFQQSDLNVVTNQWRTILPNIVKTPSYIFAVNVSKTISGNNPRAMVEIPSFEVLDQVSLDKMERLYKAQFANANGMTFIITGNFDEQALRPMLEKYVASLPSNKSVAPKYGKYGVEKVKGVHNDEFETKMETPKVTSLVLYSGDIEWNDAENLNMAAIGHILNIRYTKSIREEAGGTYGVRVRISTEQLPTPRYALTIQFDTDKSKIEQLLPLVYKEIEDMTKTGVSEENLRIFKEFNAKKFAENNIVNGEWSNYISEFYMWNNDEYSNHLKTLEGVTLESVKKSAQKAFSQGNVITVVQLPE